MGHQKGFPVEVTLQMRQEVTIKEKQVKGWGTGKEYSRQKYLYLKTVEGKKSSKH